MARGRRKAIGIRKRVEVIFRRMTDECMRMDERQPQQRKLSTVVNRIRPETVFGGGATPREPGGTPPASWGLTRKEHVKNSESNAAGLPAVEPMGFYAMTEWGQSPVSAGFALGRHVVRVQVRRWRYGHWWTVISGGGTLLRDRARPLRRGRVTAAAFRDNIASSGKMRSENFGWVKRQTVKVSARTTN